MVRIDNNDLIFLTKVGKYMAIIEEVKRIQATGAPVLVGTATIEASEFLSDMLTKSGIAHEVLNAKQHEREAYIIAQAGSPSAITIATNMAGRGTDILLGGNWKVELEAIPDATEADAQRLRAEWEVKHKQVIDAGGLHIIGSERHESRRIDNQLRGRSGRQGDPGVSRFYLSLEDDLMRIFAGERVTNMMRAMGLKDDEAIEHKMVSRSIENAQRKVEARNFDIRKNLLKYDDVANEQRKIIYGQRDDVLYEPTIHEGILNMHDDVVNGLIDNFIPPDSIEDQWNVAGLENALSVEFGLTAPIQQWLASDRRLDEIGLRKKVVEVSLAHYESRRVQMGEQSANMLERHFMLQSLDRHWKEHLAAMDYLRQGIHLRGYAQKNPEQEYKREAFTLFQNMLAAIKSEVIQDLSRMHVPTAEELAEMEAQQQRDAESMRLQFQHSEVDGLTGEISQDPELHALNQSGVRLSGSSTESNPYVGMNIGRNEPCPCGSTKKYKHCHGALV
jgi:preprotein translocase subunit SecA